MLIDNKLLNKEILNIFHSLEEQIGLQIFLHGSWADNTTTAFSDIDDFVIIDDTKLTKDEIIQIENQLSIIENQFYKIDPLQHHGHWKVYQSELNDYNNSYIPLFILEDAISIIGNKDIKANVNYNKTINGLYQSIKTTTQNIEEFYDLYSQQKLNIYELKRFVGSVVLLPPLLFQLKGINHNKREAINNANQLFTERALDLIKWATDLRNNWELLTNSSEFVSFSGLQKDMQLSKWHNFSKIESPILNPEKCSSIHLTSDLINLYVSECLNIVDTCSLQKKSKLSYDSAYKKIEQFAIESGAILVGRFGEIGSPGVSDLDVFVCFPNALYKKSQKEFYRKVYANKYLTYFIVHPAVCVSESMLPSLPYLHTISNLIITYNNKIDLAFLRIKLSSEYIDRLNQIWTLFLLPIADSYINNIKYIPVRNLLLVLKNIQTSIDNLSRQKGMNSNEVESSLDLRVLMLGNCKENRMLLETEFRNSYKKLITILNKFNNTHKSNYCILNKYYILKTGYYKNNLSGKIKIQSYPKEFFSILMEASKISPNDINTSQYLKNYNIVNNISEQMGVANPFIFLIPRIPKQNNNKYKRKIFNLLSLLPYKLTYKLLTIFGK